MPIRSFEITPELDSFITRQVESGAFKDPAHVLQAALKLLEHEDRGDEAETQALMQAVDEGEASGLAEGNVLERIREARRLRRQQPVTVA